MDAANNPAKTHVLIVRFIDAQDVVSRLINWMTNSLWCHTEAFNPEGGEHGGWIGAHAGTGVQDRPFSWCMPTRERVYAVPVTAEQYEKAWTFLNAKVGTPYDYGDIVGLSLHNRRFGRGKKRIICSALMVEFLMAAGLQPLNVIEGFEYLITPETLHLSPLFIGRCVKSVG